MAGKKKTDLRVVGKHGQIGHNSGDTALTDDQQQVLFFNHKKSIGALKDKVAHATSELRNAYKLAKSEGFLKKDFDWAFELEKDEDDKAIEDRRRQANIARWLNHPIGTQADLFSDGADTDRRSQEERGYAEGKRAGMAGEICKPSFSAGTDGYGGYMKGWHEGAAVRASLDKAEQEEGERLLRPAENEPEKVDAFDTFESDNDESFLEEPADEGAEEGADPEEENPWPDDAAIAEREPAEVL